jgi:hypothetical protein
MTILEDIQRSTQSTYIKMAMWLIKESSAYISTNIHPKTVIFIGIWKNMPEYYAKT